MAQTTDYVCNGIKAECRGTMCSTDLITFLQAEIVRQYQISRPQNLGKVNNVSHHQDSHSFFLQLLLHVFPFHNCFTLDNNKFLTSKLFLLDPFP